MIDDDALLPSAHDRATLEYYDNVAPVYVASGKNGASRWLASFMDNLPKGARILELGCGGGRDAEAMLSRGFIVDATDGSYAVAALAEQRLCRPVRVMRFDELRDFQEYDAVWANASLLHVPRDALEYVLKRIFDALNPGGTHFASYKAGGIAGRDSHGRYFNYPDRQILVDAYTGSADWDVEAIADFTGGGFEDGQGPWVAITARRPHN